MINGMLSVMERSDVDLVLAARTNDAQAFGDLFGRWYDRVFDVARNIVRDNEIAAEVAQDVFLAMWQRLDQLDDPSKFGGWALRISRNRALNRLEKERRSLSFESETMTGLHEQAHGGAGDRDDLVGSNRLLETDAISEVRDRQDLLWAATAALGARDASLVDLVLRHQLTPAEIADELEISANNAHQLLFRLRNKLGDAVANHLVWRSGQPRCADLAKLLASSAGFDAAVNKAVQKHSASCATCRDERAKVVDPQKLFAAVPVAVAPAMFKAHAAAALAGQGVPIDPSAFGGGEPSAGPAASSGGSTSTPPGSGASMTRSRRHKPQRASRRRRAARRFAYLGAGAVVLGGVLLALSRPVADSTQVEVAAPPASTTQLEPETTVAQPTTTTTSTAPTTTEAPGVTATDPETTPSTEPERPTVTIDDLVNPSLGTAAPPDFSLVVPVAAPQILRFFAERETRPAVTCPEFEIVWRVIWATENAETVQLLIDGETTMHGPTGSTSACFARTDTAELTATGPGGSVSETITP